MAEVAFVDTKTIIDLFCAQPKRPNVLEKWEDSQKRQEWPWKFCSGARNIFFFHFGSQNNLGQRPQSLGKVISVISKVRVRFFLILLFNHDVK